LNSMSFSDNHWDTAAVVSSEGRAKAATCKPVSAMKRCNRMDSVPRP
jgi:hypothetical protein